ncbi:MAG: PKD domain-containing protein [Candidatus Thermoplasmatota archaeon]|nr:PKD domain-containing protein [Candidatus Thermoplasmatota archaeon]
MVPETDPQMIVSGEPYGSVWQFNLTHSASWTDGEPFTADDVVWNININAQYYEDLWAYQPYAYFMMFAEKVDEYTVRVHFYDRATATPMPVAYGNLVSIPMLPKHKFEEFAIPPYMIGFDWNGLFEDEEIPIVATGPFVATSDIKAEWMSGEVITLSRNPGYHGLVDYGQLVHFDKIQLKFFDEPTALCLSLQNSQLDLAVVPPAVYLELKSEIDAGTLHNVAAFDGVRPDNYFIDILMNMNNAGPNPSRLDPSLRHALAMATDRSYIVDQFYLGLAEDGSTLVSPANEFWHYEPTAEERFEHNMTAAAELLEASGYIDIDADGIRECTASSLPVQMGWVVEGKKLVFEMMVRREYPEEKDIVQYLKTEWAKIGVVINYQIMDEWELATQVYYYNYDMAVWYWSADPDPNYILFTQTKAAWNGWSDTMYHSPAYEDNYTSSVSAVDVGERKTYVDACQLIHFIDCPYIILSYPDQTVVWRTDTFTGWGDWSENPGRSVFCSWSGNPLYFDLLPLGIDNTPPSITNLFVNPNPAEPTETVMFEVSMYDLDNDSLTVTIDFGDGSIEVQTTAGGTPSTQTALFYHSYDNPGLYSVQVWANDSYGLPTHNNTVFYKDRVVVCADGELAVSITPSPVVADAGELVSLSLHIDFPYAPESNFTEAIYFWSVDPVDMGSFSYRAKKMTNFTAGPVGGNGTISCDFDYYEVEFTAVAELTILPASLSVVIVFPSSALMQPMTTRNFTAVGYDSLAAPIPGLEFDWAVEGMLPGDYDLNQVSNQTVAFTPFVEGTAWLNATTTAGNITKSGSAIISIGPPQQRSVDYYWYDMFNVPFGEWWDMRAMIGKEEIPLSHEYPYLFKWNGFPEGNTRIYSNMRLNITGRNMSEINMNERPEFLPMHGSGSGGNAVIDWYLQYLTSEEMKRFPDATAAWNDGWVVSLNGTVTLDEEAALAVFMGLTPAGFDDFPTWWSLHKGEIKTDFSNWFKYEAGKDRLDIFPAYDYCLTILAWNLDAVKVGDNIVLTYDLVTWGMEVLMTMWMREAFMPTEWYFEDMGFHARIGPDHADLDVDTAVAYAVYAYEATNVPGEPCWVWEAMMQDYVVAGPPENRESLYNKYANQTYLNTAPGSAWYGKNMTYDYVPGAWNLSEGETLSFTWPAGDQMFKVHVGPGQVVNITDEMVVDYAEPMESDNSALAPGSVDIDNIARTVTYAGPIDMWDWSRSQDESSHSYLSDEWDRVDLLPRGVPYIEFSPSGAGPALFLDISDVPSNPIMDVPVNMTVSALDQYDMPYSDYSGTVTFSSDRPGEVSHPADYTFTVGDAGTHTFYGEMTFHATGWFLITCSDLYNVSVFEAQILVNVISGERIIDHFELELVPAVDPLIAGTEVSVMVTAYDQFDIVFEDYTGTVSFVTDAPLGTFTVPADYTFTVSDAGVAVLPGLMYEEPGTYMFLAFDTVNITAWGWLTIEVSSQPQIDYRLYDMFEQPWGEWWPYRSAVFKTDVILNNEPHAYTMVTNPDMINRQGIIYAPYRWNVSASGVPTVSVHDPAIMPVFGPQVENASAQLDVYFEYINHEWWDSYWVPTWSSNWNWSIGIEEIPILQEIDGYFIGTVYTARMNREAAETWMNMPQVADPLTWWAANGADYMIDWQNWISYQGNYEFDIYPGYEWAYVDIATMMDLTVDGDDVILSIGHINWGYEVLITRWMTDRAICNHEPYMEDFQLSAQFEPAYANMTYDAVAQYNLHAVKANLTESDAAWVWEPQHIDYISWPGSEFIPWEYLEYTSWNSGDLYFGEYVDYDFTPTYFNLTSYMTLTIQLPNRDDVIGYRGMGLPFGSIGDLELGDDSAYRNIQVNGPMWLGYYMTGLEPDAPNLRPMYDNATGTLFMEGPFDFDNYHHAGGELYHSAPWIEFNVANYTWPGDTNDLPPVADAGTDIVALGGEIVTLDGSGSFDDYGIVNWTWRFWYEGEWIELYGQSPQFTFWSEGVYIIDLTVRDASDQTDFDSVTVTVSGFIPEFGSVPFVVFALTVVISLMFTRSRTRRRWAP